MQEELKSQEHIENIRPYTEELIALAHDNIENMYREEEQNPLERREYHNLAHTKGVEEKAERILNVMRETDPSTGITDHDIMLARLAASHHDIDQSQKEPNVVPEKVGEKEYQKELRARYTVKIEENSAGILVGRMDQINEREKKVVFTEEDKTTVNEAIVATIPGFDRGTVIQPRLSPDASLVAHAVALADLGAMMDGEKEFLADGNRVFREDNIDIARMLDNPENLTDDQKQFIYQRIKNWYKMQVGFVEGRYGVFQEQILFFPDSVREKVKELFKFDEAIQAAKDRLQKIEEREQSGDRPSFEEMVESMGYKLK